MGHDPRGGKGEVRGGLGQQAEKEGNRISFLFFNQFSNAFIN